MQSQLLVGIIFLPHKIPESGPEAFLEVFQAKDCTLLYLPQKNSVLPPPPFGNAAGQGQYIIYSLQLSIYNELSTPSHSKSLYSIGSHIKAHQNKENTYYIHLGDLNVGGIAGWYCPGAARCIIAASIKKKLPLKALPI